MIRSWIFLSLLIAVASPAALCETKSTSEIEKSIYDHRAQVFSIEGEAKILKKAGNWMTLEIGHWVEEGDQILTGVGALVQIHFDESYWNILCLNENTQAEFRSIEPTDIFLSEGTVFNQLEGLVQDSVYILATPIAVTGVRGTRFLRRFDTARKEDEIQVAEGSVDMAALTAASEILWDQNRVVDTDHQLLIDAEALEINPDLRNLPLLPLSPESKEHLESLRRNTEETLANFVGGSEAFNRQREEWKKMMEDQQIVARIREQLQTASMPESYFTDTRVSLKDPALTGLGERQLSQTPVVPQVPTIFRGGKEAEEKEKAAKIEDKKQ